MALKPFMGFFIEWQNILLSKPFLSFFVEWHYF
jgi:hypothetical protein